MLDNLTEWQGKTPDELIDRRVRLSREGLTPEDAAHETTADGCEMMLKNTTLIDTLAKENGTLRDKVAAFIKDWCNAI